METEMDLFIKLPRVTDAATARPRSLEEPTMQQIFADKAVAVTRAMDFSNETRQSHYVLQLNQEWAVCDDEGLQPHRPAQYLTVAPGPLNPFARIA
jgi:hypothetical protein